MLTPFGKVIRQLRNEKGMRLLELAEKLDLSPAFVSGVETGRKAIPDSYVTSVIRVMDLSKTESRKLRQAADRTRKEIRIAHLSEEQRELVAAFARHPNDVPEAVLARLRKALLKSNSAETPFRRKRRGMVVPPASAKALRDFAERIRDVCVDDETIEFPIIDVLEHTLPKAFPDFCLEIMDVETMGEMEGHVFGGGMGLVLREDVYIGACHGNGRDRFTCCHELAHFLLHREVTMARIRDDGVQIYCDSEWQADTFAGALLMSKRHLTRFSDADDAAEKCGMTLHAAEVQWAKYQQEGLLR